MRSVIFGIVLALSTPASGADSLLVRTTAYTALNQAAAQTLHVVNARRGLALPEFIALPGSQMSGPLRLSKSTTLGIANHSQQPTVTRSHALDPPASLLTLFRPSPLATVAVLPFISPPGQEVIWADTAYNPDPSTTTLLVVRRVSSGDGEASGELSRFHFREVNPNVDQGGSMHWPLPGKPIDVVHLAEKGLLAILCENPDSPGSFIHIHDLRAGQSLRNAISLTPPDDRFAAVPVSLHAWPDQSRLVAITSGYDLEQPSGEIGSSVHILQTNDLSEKPVTLEIIGATPPHEDALTLDGSTLWIATQTPGADFAYLSQIGIQNGQAKVVRHIPFSGMARPVLITPAPAHNGTAIAAGKRLEISSNSGPWPPTERIFRAPIGAMFWSDEGLFVGEGARLHKINFKTGLSIWTTRLQTGRIEEIISNGTAQPILNGPQVPPRTRLDPLRQSLPPVITLRGEAAGEEHITLKLDPHTAKNWRLDFNKRDAPWLHVEQSQQPEGATLVKLSVDPVVYNGIDNKWLHTNLQFKPTDGKTPAPPINTAVRVTPLLTSTSQALWLGLTPDQGDSGNSPYSQLASLLSGPPFHMSHDIVGDPVTDSLHRYSVVILGIDALEKGILTRQVLLDYVANGGALLLIAKHRAQESTATARWLKPLGITIDTSTPVRGIFESDEDSDLTRHWKAFSIRDGCAILTENGVEVPVPASTQGTQAILALRGYGFGRVAVLASGTPVEDAALRATANNLFAHDLFQWLTSPESIVQDQDSDGLPDYVEDRNENGRVDPGETDFISFDTDGDGLADGLEDINMNGVLDEGETDPLDPDTDGDKLHDGADFSPLPDAGTPQLAAITPSTGPAEGGLTIQLDGLNFPAAPAVWIGGRRAGDVRRIDSTRITATVPPQPSSAALGSTNVIIADTALDISSRLPSGFTYTPRSRIGLALHSSEVTRQTDRYRGKVLLQLEADTVAIDQMSFRIQVSPATAIDELHILPSQQTLAANRRIITQRLGQGLLRVSLSQGRLLSGNIPLATIQWSAAPNINRRDLKFKVDYPSARVRLGGRPDIDTRELTVPLSSAISPS